MAKYFAGTRLALYGATSGAVVYQTTVGTPVRFDANIVSGCVQFPAAVYSPSILEGVVIPIGMDATTASTAVLKFEWLSSSTVTPGSGSYIFPWVEFIDSSGAIIAWIGSINYNIYNMSFYYWNGTSFVTTGANMNMPSVTAISEFQFRIVSGSSGTIQMWRNGAIELNISGISFNRTNPIRAIRVRNIFTGISYASQFAVSDFDMRGYKFPTDNISATGTFNDGTGIPANTNDSDITTSKSLPVNLNKYSGTHATRYIPGTLAIESVTVGSVMRAGGSVSTARSIMVVGGTSYSAASDISPTLTTGYEWRGQDWAAHPTLGTWTAANYNAAEKGHLAKT